MATRYRETNITTSRRTGVTNASETNNDNGNAGMEREEANRTKSKAHQIPKSKHAESESDFIKEEMSKHIETRRKVADIADISSFTHLVNSATLSATDKQLLVLHYIDHKDFRYIGDMLGYSESTIKRRHKKALIKLSKML